MGLCLNVLSSYCLSGKRSSDYCLSGMCLWGRVRRASAWSSQCPDTKNFSPVYVPWHAYYSLCFCKKRKRSFVVFPTVQQEIIKDKNVSGSRAITPKENCPPTLILILTLNQTLTGPQFFSGAIVLTPCFWTFLECFTTSRFVVKQYNSSWLYCNIFIEIWSNVQCF